MKCRKLARWIAERPKIENGEPLDWKHRKMAEMERLLKWKWLVELARAAS